MLGLLLRPIAGWVRQRALVILKPYQIAHVDIAAAKRTFPEVPGFAQARTCHLLAMTLPRGLGSSK
jgi:hypothetical protein